MKNIVLILSYITLMGCSTSEHSLCHDILRKFDENTVAQLKNLKEIKITEIDYGSLILDREYYGPSLVKIAERDGVSTLISEDVERSDFFVTAKYYSYINDLKKHDQYLNKEFGLEFSGMANFDLIWRLFIENKKFDCRALSGRDLSLYSFFLDSSLFIRAFRSSDQFLMKKGKVALLDSKKNHSILVLEDGGKKGFYVLTMYARDPFLLAGVTSQYFR